MYTIDTVYKILGWPKSSFGFLHKVLKKNQNEHFGWPDRLLMRTYSTALGTPLSVLWWPDGKVTQNRRNMCVHITGSLVAQMGKNPPAMWETWGSIPGLGRSPRIGNGYPLQYSSLENSMDREAWWATVRGVTESWTRLSDFHSCSWLTLLYSRNTSLSINYSPIKII